MAHHLGLEAVGQYVVYVVPNQVFGDGVDAVFSLQQIARCAIFLFDGQQVFCAALLEQVFKCCVKGMLFVQGGICRFAFVQNLQRHFIIDGVHQAIGVDVLAKPFVCFTPGMPLSDQWRASKGNARGVWKGLKQVVTQVRALGAVRLIDQHDDALGSIHGTKSLRTRHGQVSAQRLGHRVGQGFLAFLKFMNHHHVDVRAAGAKLHAQLSAGFNHVHPGAYQLGCFTQLLLQALPVVHQHNLVVVQVTAGAQHARQKHHRERFARALRVPHHTAAVCAGSTST